MLPEKLTKVLEARFESSCIPLKNSIVLNLLLNENKIERCIQKIYASEINGISLEGVGNTCLSATQEQ